MNNVEIHKDVIIRSMRVIKLVCLAWLEKGLLDGRGRYSVDVDVVVMIHVVERPKESQRLSNIAPVQHQQIQDAHTMPSGPALQSAHTHRI